MLPYRARRINFDEFRLPVFTLEALPTRRYAYFREEEESLLNEKGQFAVEVTSKHPYVKTLVDKAQNLGLTVSGDGTAPVKGGDIREVQQGDQITFGTSKRFDVNWIKRNEYFCKKGIRPVYDIVKDWNKIDKAMKQFAEEKRELKSNGTTIKFHSRFMVVDGRVVPYDKNIISYSMPVPVLRDLLDECIHIIVVRG